MDAVKPNIKNIKKNKRLLTVRGTGEIPPFVVSGLPSSQGPVWGDAFQEIRGEQKPSYVSAPYQLVLGWKNNSAIQTNEDKDLESGAPWGHSKTNSTLNWVTGGKDTLKSFWANYDAAYDEMRHLATLAGKDALESPEQGSEVSFWQIFATSKPSSSKFPSVVTSPQQTESNEYAYTSDNELQTSFDFANNILLTGEEQALVQNKVIAAKNEDITTPNEVVTSDEGIATHDEGIAAQNKGSFITQKEELTKNKATDNQVYTDTVFFVKEEAPTLSEIQKQAADKTNDEQQKVTNARIVDSENVIQEHYDVVTTLADMVAPAAPKLKLSDLLEPVSEGSTVKLTDLIQPPKNVIAARHLRRRR
ncbi:hypothetical protein BD408DRAFT_430969 [Parasitella parasitica]|nr:hypothetical protein BD408DRAFT_430969 [Parasitella parasitica]